MANTRVSGERVAGTGETTMYTGRGRLLGLMISHGEATKQTVTIKDGAAVFLVVDLHPEQSPFYVKFGYDKLDGIEFSTSLIVNPGLTCKVNVWYLGY